MTLSPTQILEDIERVINETGSDRVDAYKKHGQYSVPTIYNHFGSWKSAKSKLGLAPTPREEAFYRAVPKYNANLNYKEYFNDEVKPWCGKYIKKDKKRYKIGMTMNDAHDKDVDEFTLGVFLHNVARIQPDYVLLNGDIYDLYEFSRYKKDPRRCDASGRFQFVLDNIIAPIRALAPDCQIVFVVGNHELRLMKDLAENSPHLVDLMGDFMNMRFKDFFGVEQFGVTFVCKSELTAWTKKAWRDELRKNYYVFDDCFVAAHECDFGFKKHGSSGHTHTADLRVSRSAEGPIRWYVIPGACIRDADYVERITPADCGFGMFYIDTWNKQVQQEVIITSDEFCVVGGEYFYRKG